MFISLTLFEIINGLISGLAAWHLSSFIRDHLRRLQDRKQDLDDTQLS